MSADVLPYALLLLAMIAPYILLGRISHWAYTTQQRLEETNALLRELLARQDRPMDDTRRIHSSAPPHDPYKDIPRLDMWRP